MAKKKIMLVNLLGLALGAASFAAQAHTAAVATASMTFGYQLIDLDLNDGITPEIQFYSGSMLGESKIQETGRRDSSFGVETSNVSDSMGAASTTATWDAISSSSTSLVPKQFGYMQGYESYVEYSQSFLLSANTQIFFSSAVQMNANSGPPNAIPGAGEAYPIANSNAEISGKIKDTYGGSMDPYHNGGFSESLSTWRLQNVNEILRGSLYSHDHMIYGSFDMRVSTRTILEFPVTIPAVPEPGTYAMLLAGLALVGVASRRKRANPR